MSTKARRIVLIVIAAMLTGGIIITGILSVLG